MDLYKAGDKNQIDLINKTYKENFDYVINFLDDETLNDNFERKFSPMDDLKRAKSTFGNNNYWFSTTNYTETGN